MNIQKKGMTMEEQKAFDLKKKEAAQAYAKRKADARKVINDWLNTNPRIEDNVKQAILYATGYGQRLAGGGNRTGSALREFLTEGPKTPAEVFAKFEYGTPTMKQKIKAFIKSTNPIWVELKDGKYQIVGKGPEAPKGWKGFVPAEKTEL